MKVVLLSTGGTIASMRNPATGLYTAGALTGEQLVAICKLPEGMDIEVETVFQIPSNHMDFERMMILKHKIEQVFMNQDVAGIVVTHGTDTLEETAYFLDLTISDGRPVVLTGSQRTPDALGSDAYLNVRQAIIVAGDPNSRDMGVLVLFNERIFAARHIMKVHASNVAGFASAGFGYLGVVDQDQAVYDQKPLHREFYVIGNHMPEVDIVKCYAGSKGGFVTFAWESGAKGVILEAMGRGQVPPPMMKHIAAVIEKGMHVVLTTSAAEGQVYPVYDFAGSAYDLHNHGVILGKDYDSKKARIKLAVLLATEVKDIAEAFRR